MSAVLHNPKGLAGVVAGDELFIVWHGHRESDPAVTSQARVTTVGRVWVTAESIDSKKGWRHKPDRYSIRDGGIDDRGYSPRTIAWRSRAEWETTTALHEAWLKFRKAVDLRISPPPGLSVDQLRSMIDAIER